MPFLSSETKLLPDGYETKFAEYLGASTMPAGVNEEMLLVSKEQLMTLFQTCGKDGCGASANVTRMRPVGAVLEVVWTCKMKHASTWHSSPKCKDVRGTSFFIMNMILCAAIVLSGNNYSKIALLAKTFNLAIISQNTFERLVKLYVIPTVNDWWSQMQKEMLRALKDKPVDISGDGRCDSPGLSAQFCLYSFVAKDYVVHMELVDNREASMKSPDWKIDGGQVGDRCIRLMMQTNSGYFAIVYL